MKQRTKARSDKEILSYIQIAKRTGRATMTHIHLQPCDFARLKENPAMFDCTLMDSGRMVTTLSGRLLDVAALS